MKKILLFLLFPFSLFAQDGLKTLVAGGIANAYTISESLPSSYDQKERFQIIFPFNNTGASTLKRAGLAIKALKKPDGTALSASDLIAGSPYLISYNSSSGYYICETCGGSGGGGGGTVAHANNGLNLSGDTVQLGGTVTKTTIIDGVNLDNEIDPTRYQLIQSYSNFENKAAAVYVDTSATSYLQGTQDNKYSRVTSGKNLADTSFGFFVDTGIIGFINRIRIDRVGNIKIIPNGVAGTNGKVLTSDASGNASWQTASGGITALTGDVTASGTGSVAATLATVNGNVGTFGSATKSVTQTVNAKGLITAVSEQTVTPAVGSITGLGTNVPTWLATPSSANLRSALTDELGTGAALFDGATPTGLTLTNATGLPISGITGLGSGVATWLGTPTATNLSSALGSQTANTFYAAPDGSNGNATFRAISRNDLSAAYVQVGQVFAESWTNLTNWTNVGTPSAAVSGGYLTISGTASTSTNYIKNNSYGKFNLEASSHSWTVIVGTIGASTSGIGYGLVSQNTLFGTSFANSMMVNVELSTTNTGAVKWYFGSGTTFTVAQTSPALLVPVTGDTLYVMLTTFGEKYELTYSRGRNGIPVHDTFVAYTGGQEGSSGFTTVVHNAAAFSFFNIGGGSSHKVGPVTVNSLHNKNARLLIVGNSIASGYGPLQFYNRAVTKLQERTYATVEVNARPSNSILDLNMNELSSYNATEILLMCANTNDLTQKTVAQTETDLATIVTALAGISNAAAPNGYSPANHNLKFSTELPRAAISSSISTFNSDLPVLYGDDNIINLNALVNNGGTAMTVPSATGTLATSFDAVHPEDYANGLIADELIRFYGFVRKDVYRNEDVPIINIRSPKGYNTVLNSSSGITIISSMNSSREKYLCFSCYGTTNAGAMTAAFRQAQAGGEAVAIGQTTGGFGVWANSGVSNTFSITPRLKVDYSGNLVTGSTTSVVYRTTNGGSNASASLMIDGQANSLTSGTALFYANADGIGETIANGTRRIAGWAIKGVNTTTTAGSESDDIGIFTQSAGGGLTQRLQLGATALTFSDAVNVVLNTATGTKFGTGTTQKLAFYNSTPIVQPANTVAINDALVNLGLRASGGTSNFTTTINPSTGTASAGTAPEKYTSGTLMSTIEAGAVEYNNANYLSNNALNRIAIGGSIKDFIADVNNSSTTETDLFTYTTKASTLAADGEKIIFTGSGTFNDLTATADVRYYFAGTNIGDTGALTVSATGAFTWSVSIIRTGSTTARARVALSTPGASTAQYSSETDLTGLTFTNTNIIKVTGQAGGGTGGSSDITAKEGTIFWWPAANN